MTGPQNWRPTTDIETYMQAHSKRLSLNDRRAGVNALQALGPGIQPQAVPLNDANDPLGLINGWYSMVAGTLNAPNSTMRFLMEVAVDANMGGVQIAYPMERPGRKYIRTATRALGNPDSVGYSAWQMDTSAEGVFVGMLINDFVSVPAAGTGLTGWDLGSTQVDASTNPNWPDFFSVINVAYGGTVYTNAGLLVSVPGVYQITVSVRLSPTDTQWSSAALHIDRGATANTATGNTVAFDQTDNAGTFAGEQTMTSVFRCAPGEQRLLYVQASRTSTASSGGNLTTNLQGLVRISA